MWFSFVENVQTMVIVYGNVFMRIYLMPILFGRHFSCIIDMNFLNSVCILPYWRHSNVPVFEFSRTLDVVHTYIQSFHSLLCKLPKKKTFGTRKHKTNNNNNDDEDNTGCLCLRVWKCVDVSVCVHIRYHKVYMCLYLCIEIMNLLLPSTKHMFSSFQMAWNLLSQSAWILNYNWNWVQWVSCCTFKFIK